MTIPRRVRSRLLQRHPRISFRTGVTLLETLIAIFVVTVGLLGLATLIPVGRYQMEEATRIDRGAALGRAAFRDLAARGQLNMSRWAYASASGSQPTPVLNSSGGFNSPVGAPNTMLVPPLAPVVLDPLMIASNLSNLSVVQSFPYELPGTNQDAIEWKNAPRLARISILTPNTSTTGPGGNPVPPFLPLSLAQSYFKGADDRIFSRPENLEFKPGVSFAELQSGQGTNVVVSPAAVQSQGDFSWFAVVNPNRFEVLTAGAHRTRQFDVAVVVCHKRSLGNLASMTYEKRDRMRGERRVYLEFITSGGFAQGSTDAWMTMSDLPSQAEADEATFLRTGEWIMVTALAPTIPQAIAAGQPPPPHVEVNFFRVLSVGRRLFSESGNAWRRRIRLAGSNWNIPNTVSGTGTSPIAPGYGVIIDGAVAVYRKNLVYDSMGMLSP